MVNTVQRTHIGIMIVEYVRYRVAAEQIDALIAAYEGATEILLRSGHCLSVELSRCVEDPNAFVLRIEWDSLDGHLNGFRKSSDFAAFFAAVKPFVPAIEEMRHYDVLASSGR